MFENIEKFKCVVDELCLNVIERFVFLECFLDIKGYEFDLKCRFFWRMVEVFLYEIQFLGLNVDNIIFDVFYIKERWGLVMNQWGIFMKNV